jgi:hypothetical protein
MESNVCSRWWVVFLPFGYVANAFENKTYINITQQDGTQPTTSNTQVH